MPVRRFRELRAWSAASTAAVLLSACGTEPPGTARAAPDTLRASAAVPQLPVPWLESVPPMPVTAMTREQRGGQALYRELCRTCHGLYGHGDGPAARGFPGPLPDIGRLATSSGIEPIVERMQAPVGRTGPDSAPPAWHALAPETLRLVVSYVATLSQHGSRGNAAAGRLLYATSCVQCHGVRGAGDGALAAGMATPPADLRALRLEGRQPQVLAAIRGRGSRGHPAHMPPWGKAFSSQELWDLVAYLELLRAGR